MDYHLSLLCLISYLNSKLACATISLALVRFITLPIGFSPKNLNSFSGIFS